MAPQASAPQSLQPAAARLLHFSLYKNLKSTSGESFSCNIYSEMSIENLKKEYEKVLFEL
jgi:hypothetical protein